MPDDSATTAADDASTAKTDDAAKTDKTFTQEELDRVVGERIARERSKFGDYDDLKQKASKFDELAESQKTEQERLTEKATGAERRAADAESKLLRFEVAAEKNLPSKWASRLRGGTKEELAADADELLKEIQPTTDFDGGLRGRADTGEDDMDSRIRAAARRSRL